MSPNGIGYQTIQLANLSFATVTVQPSGTTVSGVVDILANGTEKISGADATISIAKFRALTMTVNSSSVFRGQPVYGIADPPQQEAKTVIASNSAERGTAKTDFVENFKNNFSLPELPNPFK